MSHFWREHRRLLQGVLIAVGAGLLYWWFVLDSIGEAAEGTRARRLAQERELQALLAGGLPDPEGVRRAKADADRLQETLVALTRDVDFSIPETLRSKSEEGAKDQFDRMAASLYEELQSKAVSQQVVLPKTFGFDEGVRSAGTEWGGELLLRLAIVDRLIREILEHAGNAGARVDAIEPLHGRALDEEAGQGRGGFLRPVQVRIRFASDARCVFAVLHGVQQKGDYLAVERLEIQKPDPAKDLMQVDLVVAALCPDPEGALSPPSGEEENR